MSKTTNVAIKILKIIDLFVQLPHALNVPDENGDWPLCLALESGQESVAASLVSHNVDLDGLDEDGQTHLHRAIMSGTLVYTRLACVLHPL